MHHQVSGIFKAMLMLSGLVYFAELNPATPNHAGGHNLLLVALLFEIYTSGFCALSFTSHEKCSHTNHSLQAILLASAIWKVQPYRCIQIKCLIGF
jgi:hypothetical protein